MRRRPPRSTRTDTLFPDTTLFLSNLVAFRNIADLGYTEGQIKTFAKGFQVPSINPDTGEPATRGGLPSDHFPSPYRSEEHTSELQSLMRISYAVFCLQKKKLKTIRTLNLISHNNIIQHSKSI